MSSQSKARAIAEVTAVLMLSIAAIWVLRISPLGAWERSLTRQPFLEYAVMMAVPLFVLKATQRRLGAYGLQFMKLKYHVEIALICSVPYAAAHATMSALKLGGVAAPLLNALLAVVSLFGIGWLLRKKPSPGNLAAAVLPAVILPVVALAWPINASVVLPSVLFYGLFLGPGEEILFRGFIESRLNEVFARSRLFFGVQWSWGAVICALLFGLFHMLNLPALFEGRLALQWMIGLSSVFWGLFFSFIREKTGSVLAGALVHGVPQALAMLVLGR